MFAPVFFLVALIAGQVVPTSELKLVGPDMCDFWHYHAVSNQTVTPVGGGPDIGDPAPSTCGYGTVFEVPLAVVYESGLPDDDFDGIPNDVEDALGLDSQKPDSNGNGILDGDEDPDLDGLTTNEELVFAGTDPDDADSDGDGTEDGTQFYAAQGERRFAVVPVIANVMNGASIEESTVVESFATMNRFLKQLRLHTLLLRVNLLSLSGSQALGDDGAGGATPGDGELGDAERDQVRSNAGQALDDTADDPVNGALGSSLLGKGLTANYAFDVDPSTDTPGLGGYPDPSFYLEPRASISLFAGTTLHQFGHTLGYHHPEPGSEEDTPSNFMTPGDAGRDTFLQSNGFSSLQATEHQRAWLAAEGFQRTAGFLHEFPEGGGPAEPVPYDYGGSVDLGWDVGMGVPAHRDLHYTGITSLGDSDPYLWGYTTYNGLYPAPATTSEGRLDAATYYLLDSDDDPVTGQTLFGVDGVDYAVELRTRDDGSGSRETFGLLRDLSGSFPTEEPLAPPPIRLELQLRFDLDGEAPIPVGEAVEFAIPKDRLGLSAPDVPVHVVSVDDTGTMQDQASFVLERDRHLADPSLALDRAEAGPGESVGYALSGLPASEAFELALDGTPVDSGTTDGSGAAAGSFDVPGGASGSPAFVTAVASSGAFAASGVRLVPEPGAALAAAAALGALAALRRRP